MLSAMNHSASHDTSGTQRGASSKRGRGGGISKRAKKTSDNDGASLRAFVYSCVCLFLSDFYYIFQK